jgi:hypothetical protein
VLAAVKDASREWPEGGPSLTAAARAGISPAQVGTEGWCRSNKRISRKPEPRKPDQNHPLDSTKRLNLRGYRDLEVENRAKTWTAFVTFAISPKAPDSAPAKPIVRKY